MLTIADVDLPDGSSDAERDEARAGRAKAFREDTRGRRIEIAREAEHRFERKVSWAVRVGDRTELFTHVAAPAMTRLRQPERLVLDTLVDAGVARSRAEALPGASSSSPSTRATGSASCARRWRTSRTCAARAPAPELGAGFRTRRPDEGRVIAEPASRHTSTVSWAHDGGPTCDGSALWLLSWGLLSPRTARRSARRPRRCRA